MCPGGRETRMGTSIPQIIRKYRSVKPAGPRELPEVDEPHATEISQEVPSLDKQLQNLRDLLSSFIVPASAEQEEDTPTVHATCSCPLCAVQIVPTNGPRG
ncbi:unnamed protein product [Arctogadus glacialis]